MAFLIFQKNPFSTGDYYDYQLLETRETTNESGVIDSIIDVYSQPPFIDISFPTVPLEAPTHTYKTTIYYDTLFDFMEFSPQSIPFPDLINYLTTDEYEIFKLYNRIIDYNFDGSPVYEYVEGGYYSVREGLLYQYGKDSAIYKKYKKYLNDLVIYNASLEINYINTTYPTSFEKKYYLKYTYIALNDGTGYVRNGFNIFIRYTDFFKDIGVVSNSEVSRFLQTRKNYLYSISGISEFLQPYQRLDIVFPYDEEKAISYKEIYPNANQSTFFYFLEDGFMYFSLYDKEHNLLIENDELVYKNESTYIVYYYPFDFRRLFGVANNEEFDSNYTIQQITQTASKIIKTNPVKRCCLAECFGITE